jgi:hypothetical protein
VALALATLALADEAASSAFALTADMLVRVVEMDGWSSYLSVHASNFPIYKHRDG